MKAVKVEYKVKPEYVEQNKANIRRVMDKVKELKLEGMMYASFTLDDGQTFVHINIARDDEAMAQLSQVEEFNEFRMALKASGPIEPPKQSKLNLVGAGFEV